MYGHSWHIVSKLVSLFKTKHRADEITSEIREYEKHKIDPPNQVFHIFFRCGTKDTNPAILILGIEFISSIERCMKRSAASLARYQSRDCNLKDDFKVDQRIDY